MATASSRPSSADRAVRAPGRQPTLPLAVVLIAAACGDPTGTRQRVDPGPGPHFSVSPVPVEDIGRITALGFNNVTLPNSHTYWETCETWVMMRLDRPCVHRRQAIRAPADGEVLDLDPSADGFVVAQGPRGLVWTFGHVTPVPSLRRGSRVAAGQVIATMYYTHGFDFGVTNYGIRHRYISPERYPDQSLHGQHPIAQYPEPLRSQLLERMHPAGPAYGRLAWDSLGTASGMWVLEGHRGRYLDRTTDSLQLFLARYTERPETRLVHIGRRLPGLENAMLFLDPASPSWEQVTPTSGRVAVKLWHPGTDGRPNLTRPAGTALVELLSDRLLRFEWFNTHEPVTDFTAAARRYER
jgi:hypothetical protein